MLDRFLEFHVANSGWALEGGRGQLTVFPATEFNHPELKKNVSENVPFEHVARIFPLLG